MIELGEAEKDSTVIAEAEDALRKLKAEAARRELEALLSGEADANDTFLEVHAGAGGTESQDWAQMLLRMYTRWAEQHGYKVEYSKRPPGEEAGIKSATVQIKGHNAYGWLKTENGVHRLVRISPFDSNARRHTSFASVNVYPVIDDRIKIDIKEADVRTDTMRVAAAPAASTSTRPNRRSASPISRPTSWWSARTTARSTETVRRPGTCCAPSSTSARLKRREEKAAAEQAAKTDIGWGHQIRSYVLQPYQMVKDLRTGVRPHDTVRVLDGDLDQFMAAALAQKAFGGGAGAKSRTWNKTLQ